MIALFNIRRGKKCWRTEKWTYRQTDRIPPWPRNRKYIQTNAWKNLDAHLLRSPSYPHESWEHLVLDQEQLPSFTTIRFQWTHFSLSLRLYTHACSVPLQSTFDTSLAQCPSQNAKTTTRSLCMASLQFLPLHFTVVFTCFSWLYKT